MHASGHARALLGHHRSVAGQVAQLALRPLGHKTRPQQSTLQAVRDPLCIAHVALAPRHLLEVLGVDQQHRALPFEQGVHRLPEHARRLHCDMRHPGRAQPVAQLQQVRRHRANLPDLLEHAAVGLELAPTNHDGRLVHVEPGDGAVEPLDVAARLLPAAPSARGHRSLLVGAPGGHREQWHSVSRARSNSLISTARSESDCVSGCRPQETSTSHRRLPLPSYRTSRPFSSFQSGAAAPSRLR